MTDRELMQQGLDALEHLQTDIEWQYKSPTRAMLRKVEKELRARLAQGEPEPVAWGVIQRGKGVWFVDDSRFTAQHYANHYSHRDAAGFDQKVVPLYTAPPQREWQGLTDDEIWNADEIMAANSECGASFETLRELVHAISDKLKEKNT